MAPAVVASLFIVPAIVSLPAIHYGYGESLDGRADAWLAQRGGLPWGPREALEPVEIGNETQIHRDYLWVFHSVTFTWRLALDDRLPKHYAGIDRDTNPVNYARYVRDTRDDAIIDALAAELARVAAERGYSRLDRANFALAFVQGLRYIPDELVTRYDDFPKYPLETLLEEGGDCEDTSILYASLLAAMGEDVALLYLGPHMSAGVGVPGAPGPRFDGYLYAETSRAGFRVGEVPLSVRHLPVQALPAADPAPVLDVSWSLRREGDAYRTAVTVWNNGTAPGHDVNVWIGLEGKDDTTWHGKQVNFETVAPGTRVKKTVHLPREWVPEPERVYAILQAGDIHFSREASLRF